MTAISDFVAHPRTFLNENLLRANFLLKPGMPVRSFRFQPHPYTGTRLSDGRVIPSYGLVPLSQNERISARSDPAALGVDYLNAYWCPYEDDAMHAIVVGGAADFMFTTNMDGCTFGVGTATATGERRVAHVNLRSQTDSHAKQRGTLAIESLDAKVVEPDRYMSSPHVPGAIYGEIKATTIGIRNRATGQWDFYYQQYRLLSGAVNQPVLVRLRHLV